MSASLRDQGPAAHPKENELDQETNVKPKKGLLQETRVTVEALLRTIVIFCFVLAALKGSLLASKIFRSDSQVLHSDLDIVAAIVRTPGGLSIVGRVLYEGEPATNARIWCIAKDEAGNRFSPTNASQTVGGHFRIEGLPGDLTNQNSEVKIFARSSLPALVGNTPLRGEAIVMTKGARRQANIMDSKLWPCTLGFFCVSIFIGLAIQAVAPVWRRQLYIASVMTALALTAGMLFAIAEAYMNVKASVTEGQTWSIGFISIFKGTYVKDLPEQWLLSLTGPPQDGTTAAPEARAISGESVAPSQTSGAATIATVIQGLGAPMWVVFLSVIGAALSTVTLVVKEIKSPPSFFDDNPVELRERLLMLVQNQFFMIFAPLGSIFVYQGLVLASAAAQPFVVALAAMGAGATLNSILALAISRASELFTSYSQKGKTSASAASSAPNAMQTVAGRASTKPVSPALGNDEPRVSAPSNLLVRADPPTGK